MNDAIRLNRFGGLLTTITVLNLLLALHNISSQPACADDFGVAVTAVNYMEGGQLGPAMWNHPVLRNILVYLSMKLFGTGVLGVKFWSVLFGVLSVPLLGGITRRISRDDRAALLAAFFLAVDPLFLNFERQGINDVYLAFFPLAGIWLALLYLSSGRAWLLVLAGIAMGGGLSSKLSVLFPLLVTFCACLLVTWRRGELSARQKTAESFFVCAALCALPLLIYLVTFMPWFGRGYGMPEWITLQREMLLETRTHTGYNPATINRDKRAGEWFIKPVGHATYILPGRAETEGEPTMEQMQGATNLLGMSNPLVWLLTLPATAVMLWRAYRKPVNTYVFGMALFIVSYVPFLLAGRPIWVNTAIAVIPYAFMLVAIALSSLLGRLRFGKTILIGYLCAVLVMFVPLYLLAIGEGSRIQALQGILAYYAPRHVER